MLFLLRLLEKSNESQKRKVKREKSEEKSQMAKRSPPKFIWRVHLVLGNNCPLHQAGCVGLLLVQRLSIRFYLCRRSFTAHDALFSFFLL